MGWPAESGNELGMPDFMRIAAVVVVFLGTLWFFGFVR
jgi:hypothetical protein